MFKRVLHAAFGHPYDDGELISKEVFEDHHASDTRYIYTTNTYLCKCGATFSNSGVEYRVKLTLDEWLELPDEY